MIRPMSGQVLLRILPPETRSKGGIELPQHRLSPEEQMERNHHPEPPPPEMAYVEAIGPWKRLKNGLAQLPPFPAGSTVLIRPSSGQELSRNVNEKLRLVRVEDVLAVLS